jgi:hypothetical protein
MVAEVLEFLSRYRPYLKTTVASLMFRRYAIVDERDLRYAVLKLAGTHKYTATQSA